MRSRSLQLFAVVFLFLLGSSPALAFDGNRKGFVLGIGVGPSGTSFKQKLKLSGGLVGEGKRETKVGVATDFKIGYGASEQLLIVYDNRVSWFEFTNVFVSGASNAAIVYYMQPQAPSVYVTGGLGLSVWSSWSESGSTGSTGIGIFGGAGYAFSKLWNVEGTISYGNPSHEESGAKLETNAISFHATFNLLAY